MTGLMALVVMGLFLLAIPPIIPVQYRSWAVDNGARAIGIIIILFAFASTSFVFVPDGHLGHLFRVYGGGSLTEGRMSPRTAKMARKPRSLPRGSISAPCSM